MQGESNIPIFLWIATAILAHLAWAGGADRVSTRLQETIDVMHFAQSVQRQVKGKLRPVEVALLGEEAAIPQEEAARQRDALEDDPESDAPEESKPEEAAEQEEKSRKMAAEDEREEERRKKEKKRQRKEEEKVTVEAKPAVPVVIPELEIRKRIAVRQHVKDKNQSNPDAEFIADEANKVAEQTQARITSTTENDPSPTPGGNHAGPTETPGDSDADEVAQTQDSPGEMDRAPQDEADGTESPEDGVPPADGDPRSKIATRDAVRELDPKLGCVGCDSATKRRRRLPARDERQARAAESASEERPETATSQEGRWTVGRAASRKQARRARRARRRHLPPPRRRSGQPELLGYGSRSRTQSGINLNLTPRAAVAAIGTDQLRRERLADGERRRSKHRGSWKSVGLERWRSAIENYVASVKPGNQTALNTARVPFASYLNAIHNRLHPVFADSFLRSLDSLPSSHPMNRPDIKTNLEIVVTGDAGRVVKMGVTRTSGVTAFDIAALESVQRAQPFGTPPRQIVSPDGNVYLHWEFHRNPYYACSTYFARPFILKVKPRTAPPRIKPPFRPPFGPRERDVPTRNERHGLAHPAEGPDGRAASRAPGHRRLQVDEQAG